MEFKEVIEKRSSCWKFRETFISDEEILEILNSGRLAPSAKNRQPWYFIIVKDCLKNKIGEILEKYVDTEENRIKLGTSSSVNETGKIIKEGSVLILIFREKNDNWIYGDLLSIGGCVENMCLSATNLGLNCLWMRDTLYAENEIKKLVFQEDKELVCGLLIGRGENIKRKKKLKNLNDIVQWM